MPRIPLITAVRPSTLLPAADRQIPIGCTTDGTETVAANVQYKVRESATLSNLWAYVDTVSSANATLDLQIGGTDGNQTVDISTTGAKEDTSNTDSVSSGNYIHYQYDRAAGQSGVSMISIDYESSSGNLVVPYISNSPNGLGLGSLDRYPCVMGELSGTTSTTLSEREIHYDATWSNLTGYAEANTKSVSVSVRSVVNGVNGNQIASWGVSTSGEVEDTSNTDDLAPGDLIDYEIDNVTGGGVITVNTISSLITYDATTGFSFFSDTRANGVRAASATTHYLPIFGGFNSFASNTSEASAQVRWNVAGTFSNVGIMVASNSYSANATARMRINGSDGNIVITITSSTSNTNFEDTSNTDEVSAGDLICLSIVGGTSGNLTLRGTTAQFEYAVGSTRRIFMIT